MRRMTNQPFAKFFVLCFLFVVPLYFSPGNAARADGPRSAEETVAALKVYDDLHVEVFASEPMITNPTNITVDERGRVWVCDVMNYRGNLGKRPEGDRILVLEDTDGDGRADRSTVFYQGHDVDSALGICVLGKRVIVSCSPDVFVLTDEDGDGKADKKELLYTKTGIPQHDHTAHAFVFGPDGHLYWNIGNENQGVFDKQGEPVVDIFGRQVLNNGDPYRQGMAFRQNLAGDQFEVLAYNLRNSYELTVDAFGDVWFTDNDDDGNASTRFCYTLKGGNYGYTDELTGQGWKAGNRTGMSEQVSRRHWHQNDPGSVPNVLDLGSGSPSGIEVYEGRLLPESLRGGIVHCEPGHNVVRVYLPNAEGAGYTAETLELIDGRGDQWFRPVDVATAPDGSLMIADWYDPGVGGHRQADLDRGRIYRVAPAGHAYQCNAPNLEDPARACHALCSGNQSVRFLAWTALADWGRAAEPALENLSRSETASDRARAFWLLTRLSLNGPEYLNRAASDSDPRVRAAAARMTAQVREPIAQTVMEKLAGDSSAQVRRAVAIELRRYAATDFAPQIWARLAEQYDGTDRWYLEALGLAAEGHWDQCLDAWLARAGEDAWRTPAGRMLIARSRGKQTLKKLAELIVNSTTPSEEIPHLLRAIDFNLSAENRDSLLVLMQNAKQLPEDRQTLILSEVRKRMEKELPTHKKKSHPLVVTQSTTQFVPPEQNLPLDEWMQLVGDAQRGKALFHGKANCATCHQVGMEGKDVGPALTEIGSKLSRTALYESLLYPSLAVSHNYGTYVAITDAGTAVTGLLIGETDETITLKTDKAELRELRRDELEELELSPVSLMPSGLEKLITPQELADLVAYLGGLKQQPASKP